MRDMSKNRLDNTNSLQKTSRKDTFQRLAQQVDGGATSSADGYETGKRIGPTTGVESLQYSSNRFLDSLQQTTRKAGMDDWSNYQIRQGFSNHDPTQWHTRQDPNWQNRVARVDEELREQGYNVGGTSQRRDVVEVSSYEDQGHDNPRPSKEWGHHVDYRQGHHDAGTSRRRLEIIDGRVVEAFSDEEEQGYKDEITSHQSEVVSQLTGKIDFYLNHTKKDSSIVNSIVNMITNESIKNAALDHIKSNYSLFSSKNDYNTKASYLSYQVISKMNFS